MILIRLLLILMLSMFLSAPVLAQEADEGPVLDDASDEVIAEDELDVASEPEPEPEPEPEFDETGLDEQGFANEDDDFDPTEEIPTDQSIDFPTDI
jgi:hypothetical protein